MSATNQRVTRSVSRALSDDSAAPSRAATPARVTRARGSRRATSPAVADDENDEKPDVLTKSNQAYGTQGKSVLVEQASVQLAMSGNAEDVITEAVEKAARENAEARQLDYNGNRSGLAVVNEEYEEERTSDNQSSVRTTSTERRARGELGGERDPPNRVDTDPLFVASEPEPEPERPSYFSRQYWAPKRQFPSRKTSDLTNQEPLLGYIQSSTGNTARHPVFVPKGTLLSHFSSMFWSFVAAMVAIILFLLWYEIFRGPILNPLRFNSLDQTSVLPTGTVQQLLHATSHDYDRLSRRIGTIEQHLKKLPLTFDTAPKHQVNWFTPGFGASIDEHLSSPTAAVCDPFWTPWPLNFIWRQSCPEHVVSAPQLMALQAWDDPALERWCAPKTPYGKLQLAVNIERPISPTELVVEHVKKDSTPTRYMRTAPQEVELWIKIEDHHIRAMVGAAIDKLYPDLWADSSPQGRELSIEQTLGPEFIPVGRWYYNIYSQAESQSFKIPIPLYEYGVETTKVAVRINSNWGNEEFTCVNRLRLHGLDTSGIMEALEEEPAWLSR